MNCGEFKKLIIENANLPEQENPEEFSSHLESCPSCKAAWNYEKSLTHCFSQIALKPPQKILYERVAKVPQKIADQQTFQRKIVIGTFSMAFAIAAMFIIIRPDKKPEQTGKATSTETQGTVVPLATPTQIILASTKTASKVSTEPSIEAPVIRNLIVNPTISKLQQSATPVASSVDFSDKAKPVDQSNSSFSAAPDSKIVLAAAPSIPAVSVEQQKIPVLSENSIAQNSHTSSEIIQIAALPKTEGVIRTKSYQPGEIISNPHLTAARSSPQSFESLVNSNTSGAGIKSEMPTAKPSLPALVKGEPLVTSEKRIVLARKITSKDDILSSKKESLLDESSSKDNAASENEIDSTDLKNKVAHSPAQEKKLLVPPAASAYSGAQPFDKHRNSSWQIARIIQILKNHSDEVTPGIVPLDDWVLNGWLTVKERIALAPADGKKWFSILSDNKWQVKLIDEE
ncbi:MAG: hypothetical protein HQM10_02870 [Candidatus Riflebacteria bacterium]|nr:hypothetical protein [Candidatus Riflebacteria bacterium]